MLGRLLAVAAIILFLFVGVPVIQQGLWESSTATQPQNGFNDSFTVTEGQVNELSNSDRSGVVYAPQSDITVKQNGEEIEAPGNWTWNRHNGTIAVSSGTSFSGGDTAHAIGYYTRPSASQNLTTTLGLLPSDTTGQIWQLIAGVILVLGALGILARVG